MTDSTFPVKTILLAAAAAPISYGVTLMRKSVPGAIALIAGYLSIMGLVFATSLEMLTSRLVAAAGFVVCFAAIIYGYTLLAITFHRIFLLGARAVPGIGITHWTYRETRFFGWGLAIGLLMMVIAVPLVFLLGTFLAGNAGDVLADEEVGPGATLAFYAGVLPMIYVISRWSFIFPATATDSRPSLSWAWGFSQRYHWQVFLVIGLSTLIIEVATELLAAVLPAWLAIVFNVVVGVYLGVFGIAVLSFSYGFLKEAQPDLLPPGIDEAA